jgi:alpha-beta hydrolase superfamily lysophospholipase
VVVVHDCGATRGDTDRRLLHLQRDYVRRGYSVFAFDLRGHGESAGKRDPLGCTESLDVQAAVTYVKRRVPRAPVVLHGFGFGASLALTAAANGTEVAAIIADSPFMSMRSYLRRRWSGLPRPLFSISAFLARRLFRSDINALRPIQAVPRVSAPIFFIHNEHDRDVPMMDTLNLAAGSLDERDRLT